MMGTNEFNKPSRWWQWTSFGLMPLLLAFSISFAITAYRETHSTLAGTSSSESSIRTSLESLMGLSPVPERAAPNFTLTDQRGKLRSLSSFKGRSVLLTFMDTQCTEVCPVLASELLVAQRILGHQGSHVVFIAINVNPHANSVADVNDFTRVHGLDSLHNWYFFTGSLVQLAPVWRSYGVEVIAPVHGGQTTHSSYIFFLNPFGRERFLADANAFQSTSGSGYLPRGLVNRWGQGIAKYLLAAVSG